jgi:hypothetical protein
MGFVTRYSKITPAKKWEPLIPLDVLTDGLKYKQQMFDKNAAIIEAQLSQGSALASQIDNDEVKKQYQSDFNNLVTNINTNFSTADITKKDVMGSINEAGRSIAENTTYATALSMSRHFRDQDKLIEQSKTKDGGKFYNPSAEHIINKKAQQFKKASAKDMGGVPLVEYSPYYDTTEQEMKLIDKIKPEVEAEITNMGIPKSSDMYIQRVEELTKDRVKSAMLNLYQNDPKALRQFQFDYEYNMDTKPIDIDVHAQEQFNSLNQTIKGLRDVKDKLTDPALQKQADEAIAAYQSRFDSLSKRYEDAKATKDPTKYYTINDFMMDRADGAANTYSYKKVLSLAADPFSLATKNHDFKMIEMQAQHTLNVQRDRLKAYADVAASADNIQQSLNDGIIFEGSVLLNSAVSAGDTGITISNGDVANLTGESNPPSDGQYGLNGTAWGSNIRTSSFMGKKLHFDKKTGTYYMMGSATSKQKVKIKDTNGNMVDPPQSTMEIKDPQTGAITKEAVYRYENVKVEVNPRTAALTRNKVAYGGNMKATNMAQGQYDVFEQAQKGALQLYNTNGLSQSGTTLVTELGNANGTLNTKIAAIADARVRAQATKYVNKLKTLAAEKAAQGQIVDIYTLSLDDPMTVGSLNYLLQTSTN